jgi:hypothetical protein
MAGLRTEHRQDEQRCRRQDSDTVRWRKNRPAGAASIVAGRKWWVIVAPCLLITAAVLCTSLREVAPPVRGSAGNASGQVPLPPLSVEIHDRGFTVYEGDDLIETLPWAEDTSDEDSHPVVQPVRSRRAPTPATRPSLGWAQDA